MLTRIRDVFTNGSRAVASTVYDYFVGLKQRLTTAPANELGIFIGSRLLSIYGGMRAYFSSGDFILPVIGVVHIPTSYRTMLGLGVGWYYGGTFGNRFAQCIEVLNPNHNQKTPNQLFIMRAYPALTSIICDILIRFLEEQNNKSFFEPLGITSEVEGYILSTLFIFYFVGTMGFRGGKDLDLITNNTLIADFGLFTASKATYAKFKEKCCPPASLEAPAINRSAPEVKLEVIEIQRQAQFVPANNLPSPTKN